jgi:dTDP-4-dehydrorhamnose 3,5-epimerase
MIFTETRLKGAYVIDVERREDARGFFARAFCQHEFEVRGLKPVIAQANVNYNRQKGTLRGMHFQIPPAAETKLVRCTRGAILDIIVSPRPRPVPGRRVLQSAECWRYDDPRLGLTWPLPVTLISEKDQAAPLLET